MVAKTARKKKTSETVKQELLSSLKENDNLEEPDIDATADTITYTLETIRIIQSYEEIMKTQNKRALGKQGQLLKKFRETEQNVGQKKSKIYFKIGLYKCLKKYPKLKKSTLSSNYFQKNFKVIKIVCKNNITLSS